MNVTALFQGQDVSIQGADVTISSLVCDSRQVAPGSLFAAFSGTSSDGHDFIPTACENGAAAILCERAEFDAKQTTAIIAADARKSLALAAKVYFGDPSNCLKTVGLTGTNGKTTTAHLIAAIFEAAKMTPGVIGTLGVAYGGKHFETGLTTPESIDLVQYLRDMVDAGVDGAIMEVSSHALVQHRVAGVEFDVGVFTNLTQDHLDYHQTFEAYFEAKSFLFTKHLKPDGLGVLNLDDPHVSRLRSAESIGFSMMPNSDAQVRLVSQSLGPRGTSMVIATPAGEIQLDTHLVGDFNTQNVLAAVGVGLALELPLETITRGLQTVRAVPGRLEKVNRDEHAHLPLVLVDYAHTPDALSKALQAVRAITKGRLICVFGCGGDRDTTKREPMGRAAGENADWSLVTNDNPRSEEPNTIADAVVAGLEATGARRGGMEIPHAYDVELERSVAIATAIQNASSQDCVLIAGKGHEDYQIIQNVKRFFDDKEQALKVLEGLKA